MDKHCPRWAWSYEPWDAKLARSARPEHVLQIALYGDLLAAVQGSAAPPGLLDARHGEPAAPYAIESFRLDERALLRAPGSAAARGIRGRSADGLGPSPAAIAASVDWSGECEARWEETDHLCRVADITKQQMQAAV